MRHFLEAIKEKSKNSGREIKFCDQIKKIEAKIFYKGKRKGERERERERERVVTKEIIIKWKDRRQIVEYSGTVLSFVCKHVVTQIMKTA